MTREAWFARAAAADVGVKQAECFPIVELDGNITRQKQAALGGQSHFCRRATGPSLRSSGFSSISAGARPTSRRRRRALFAADWVHNATIQNVVLQVAQSYYQYLNAKALVAARQANLEEAARESLDAAEERHRAGVATIADVLQAQDRTLAGRARRCRSAQGQVQVIRGALATALGVPANIPVEAGELPRRSTARPRRGDRRRP